MNGAYPSLKEDAPQCLENPFLEEIVIDESYLLQTAVLQISQRLRHDFIFSELVDRNVHFRLRLLLRLGLDVALQGLSVNRTAIPQQCAVEIDGQVDHF